MGCGSGAPPLAPAPFDGGLLAGKRFQSLEQRPIGGRDDAPLATWTVRFEERTCSWGYYNVTIEGGCQVLDDGAIVVKFWPEPTWEVRGSYDPKTQRLVFDGVAYAADKPLDMQQQRAAQSPENLRLLTFVKYLEQADIVLREDEAVGWRVGEPEDGVSLGVRLWAFPIGTSYEQMQAATGLKPPDEVLLDASSCLAMTPPAYFDAKGKLVEVEVDNDDEAIEQLSQQFRHYRAPVLPADYWIRPEVLKAWSQPTNVPIRALANYLVSQGLSLEFDPSSGYWEIDAGSAADRIRVMLRAFPRDASELEMRHVANSVNLAFMINPRGRLSMSYPPDSAEGKRLTDLFMNYRP